MATYAVIGPRELQQNITDMQLLEPRPPSPLCTPRLKMPLTCAPRLSAHLRSRPNQFTTATGLPWGSRMESPTWRRQNGRSSRLSLAVLRRERWVNPLGAAEATASETLTRPRCSPPPERRWPSAARRMRHRGTLRHPCPARRSGAATSAASALGNAARPHATAVAAGRYQAQQPPRNDRRPFLLDPRPHRHHTSRDCTSPGAATVRATDPIPWAAPMPDMVGPTNFRIVFLGDITNYSVVPHF
jgi:hypothetical protein